MAEEIDDLICWAKTQGFRVEIDGKGYRRFYSPEGQYIVRYPATPTNKRRRFQDVAVALRRHGLAWPKPSRKEQRSISKKESS